MLCISNKLHANHDGPDWHVGDPSPLAQFDDNPEMRTRWLENVTEVYADGHELDLIKVSFHHLPFCEGRHMVWTGEFARLIVANLMK